MNPTSSPIAVIGVHLVQLSRSKGGREALSRFEGAGLDPQGADDLSALVRQCTRPGAGVRRDQILATLVPLAPTDDIAALCALVALRPELIRISRLLARGPFDAEEADAEAVAIAWQVLTKKRAAGSQTPRAASLATAIWTGARSAGGLRRCGDVECVSLPEDLDPPAPDVDPLARCPGLLAAAIARGVLTPRQAVVIAQSRMDERPLTEIAAALGCRYAAVKAERRRAEAALRSFAPSYCSESG